MSTVKIFTLYACNQRFHNHHYHCETTHHNLPIVTSPSCGTIWVCPNEGLA